MDSTISPRGNWSDRRIAFVLLALGLVPVLPVLTAPLMLAYDDKWVTTENPLITGGLSEFWKQLILPFTAHGADTGHWSPLIFLTFALEHKLTGAVPAAGAAWGPEHFSPVFHRLLNGLYHGANAVLVFRLGQRLLRQRESSVFAALIFLFHPLVCESVCWVVERNNLMTAFFGLLSLDVFTGARTENGSVTGWQPPSWPRVFAACGILLLSQLCKLSGVVWWPVLVAWDFLFFERGGRALGRSLFLCGLRAVALFPPIALSLYTGVVTCEYVLLPQIADPSLGAIGPWLSSGYLFLRYLLLMLLPYDLSAFYHVPMGMPPWSDARFFGGLAALGALIFAGRRAGLSWAFLILAFVWMVSSVAPPINPLKTTAFIIQDRYTYPGLAALGMLISALVFHFVSRLSTTQPGSMEPNSAKAAKPPYVICGAVLGVLLVLMLHRATYWRNLEELFADATLKQPRASMAHTYYADYLFHSGGMQDPIKRKAILLHFEAALACDDFEHLQWPMHYQNEYANALLSLELPQATAKAKVLFEQVWNGREERPSERGAKVMAVRYLVYDHFQNGRMKEGFELLDKALKLHPENIELRINRILALEQTLQFSKAREEGAALLAHPKLSQGYRQVLNAALERMKNK